MNHVNRVSPVVPDPLDKTSWRALFEENSERVDASAFLMRHRLLALVVVLIVYICLIVYSTEYRGSMIVLCILTLVPDIYYTWKSNEAAIAFSSITMIWSIVIYFCRLALTEQHHALAWILGAHVLGNILTRKVRGGLIGMYVITVGTFLMIYAIHNLIMEAVIASCTLFVVGHFITVSYFEATTEYNKILDTNEQFLKYNEVQAKFVSSISHEFRSPLMSVLGSVELLSCTELNTEQTKHLKTIRSCSSILLQLIDDVLSFSKLEHEHREANTPRTPVSAHTPSPIALEEAYFPSHMTGTVFDVRGFIDTTVDIMNTYASKLNVYVVANVNDDVPEKVSGDLIRIQQCLINLMSNAAKVTTENGAVTLHVSVSKEDILYHHLEFKVSDKGPGIPVEKQHLIFTPFSQITNHGRTHIPSSGLGLVICRRVIIKMGGTIDFTSSTGEDHGTTFIIVLPLEKVSEQTPTPSNEELVVHKRKILKNMKIEHDYMMTYQEQEETKTMRRESLPSIKINECAKRKVRARKLEGASSPQLGTPPDVDVLLAEDDRIIKNILTRLLSSRGYRVIPFKDGKELIDHVKQSTKAGTGIFTREIVVSDYHMPKIDGVEAAKQLKIINPNLKIILLTADAYLQGNQLECVDKLLMKPVQSAEIDSAIRELLL